MRVCHVCSGHNADDPRVFHHECCSLAEAGYDVHLLAIDRAKQPYQNHGVTIHPLPALGRLQRLTQRAHVARMAVELEPDLFHVHEPELLGPVIARAGSRPVIWDVHEVYLDVLMEHGSIPVPLRIPARASWDFRERQLLRRCDGVLAATTWVAQRYQSLHKRVEVVANFPTLKEVEQLPEVDRDGGTCVFAGALNPTRGLPQVLRALAILMQRGLKVELHLAGPASSERFLSSLLAEAEQLGVGQMVKYHGALPRVEALLLMKRCGIGLVPNQPCGTTLAMIPIKMIEFMALGLPIVYSDLPNHRETAGAAGAGLPVDATRPEAIAEAIDRLVNDKDLARRMGEAGKRAVRERFNWAAERVKLLNMYREILGGPNGRSS